MPVMEKTMIRFFLYFFFSLFFINGFGEEKEIFLDMEELLELSIEELMNVRVSVASKNENSLRETPGIVTVVTEQEIINSGARDLIDILRLVPGFDFGVDISNIVGVSIRGSWAYEGKVLLLIDGIEINERELATTQFGQHYPIEHIKRIEIIRGPGSVIYGGSAELGVINIITKDYKDLKGVSLIGNYGHLPRTYGRKNLNLMIGKEIDDIKISALGLIGYGHRSDREYTDIFGNIFNMGNGNELYPSFINLALIYKDLNMRVIIDNYQIRDTDSFSEVRDFFVIKKFKTNSYELGYKYKNNYLKVNSSFNYLNQIPWEITHGLTGKIAKQVVIDKYTGKLNIAYKLNQNIDIVTGGEFYSEQFKDKISSSHLSTYKNLTAFIENLFHSNIGNLTLGLRFDNHNTFGTNLAPRIGFTKAFNKLHFKTLYSNSFRSPTIYNYQLNNQIRDEETNTFEFEVGFQINEDMAMATNVFDISTKNMIIFGITPRKNEEIYHNADNTHTRGIETEFRITPDWGYLTLNHSYYRAINDSVDDFKVIDYQTNQLIDDTMRLAFPAHKVTLNSHYKWNRHFSINPSLIYYSPRYGYNRVDDSGQLVLAQYPSSVLANIFFRYEDAFYKNLDLGVGVYDIFGENYDFIQPYSGGHAPLPGPSREVIFELAYRF